MHIKEQPIVAAESTSMRPRYPEMSSFSGRGIQLIPMPTPMPNMRDPTMIDIPSMVRASSNLAFLRASRRLAAA